MDVVVYPLPWPLLVGGVRCSRLWSTSQLLRPSGQQCSHSGGVCPQIQGRQCGAYVGAVEEMMCVVCVDVTEVEVVCNPIMMGRWSELMVVGVCHSDDVMREADANDTSGELESAFLGSLVGVFRTAKLKC